MNTKLKPILIEIDSESIAREVKLWEQLTESLNDLFGDWKEYFSEEMSLDVFRTFQETKDKAFFLGEKYLSMKEEHSSFLERMKLKVKEYLKIVDLPSFEHLLSGSEKVASLMLQVHADDLKYWFEKCKGESGFFVPAEFVSAITERYSTYAKSPVEILAYHYLVGFCESINIISNTGVRIEPADLPPIFFLGNVVPRYAEDVPWLEKPPKHYEPGAGLFRKDSPLITRLSKLPEDYILELIEKYSGKEIA